MLPVKTFSFKKSSFITVQFHVDNKNATELRQVWPLSFLRILPYLKQLSLLLFHVTVESCLINNVQFNYTYVVHH